MKNRYKFLLCIVIIVSIGLLGYSTWHQWNANQNTILERMKPIPPMVSFVQGAAIKYIAYDPKNPDLIAAFSGNTLAALLGKTSPDDSDYIVKIWNLKNQETPILTLKTHKEQNEKTFMVGLGFSPIDNWIATQTSDTLEIWDSATGSKINTLHKISKNFAISPVDNRLALDYSDLSLWEVNDPKNIKGRILLPPLKHLEAISLGLEDIITPYPKDEEGIADYRNNYALQNKITEYRNAFGNDEYKAIDFSHDGRWLAAAGKTLNVNSEWEQVIRIWDLQTHRLYKTIDRDESRIQEPKQKEKATAERSSYSNDVHAIEFSHDNRFIGFAADNRFTIWSLPDWNIYHEVLDKKTVDVVFSPNGKVFAMTDGEKVTLWSIDELTPIALLKEKEFMSIVNILEFSQNGEYLAAGGWTGVLWIWDVSELYEN